MLDDIAKGRIIKPYPMNSSILRFVIARKWNSWYPSYFNTEGGCYAFITRNVEPNEERNYAGVIAIDPGFNFMENLRRYFGVEPNNIRNIIVSHYHPDHVNGLFEFITLNHELKVPCSYYLNPTTYDFFRIFEGVSEVVEEQKIRLVDYIVIDNNFRNSVFIEPNAEKYAKDSIYFTALKTFHREIGNRHNSLGFSFDVLAAGKNPRKILLLGDTDGDPEYLEKYLGYIKDVEIAILHLGSYSNRGYGKGDKHLYKRGLIDIFNCINCVRGGKIILKEGKIKECIDKGIISLTATDSVHRTTNSQLCKMHKEEGFFENLKLVLVSELGLEMAPIKDLSRSFDLFDWSSGLYPLLLFSKYYSINMHDKSNREGEIDRLILDILGAKSVQALKEINSKQQSITNRSKLYNSSTFLAYFLYYSALKNEIRDLPNNKKRHYPLWRKIEDLMERLKPIDGERLTNYPFDIFIESFNTSLNKMGIDAEIGLFNIEIRNFILELLKRSLIVEENLEATLLILLGFSKELFNAIKGIIRFGAVDNTDIDYREYNFEEIIQFAKSASFFPNEDLLGYINYLHDNFSSSAFNNFMLLFSYLLDKQAKLIWPNIESISYEQEFPSLMKDLSEIMNNYSSKNIKYFLSDIGIELDLSAKDLRIKDSLSNWIRIDKASQYIDKEGNCRFADIDLDLY